MKLSITIETQGKVLLTSTLPFQNQRQRKLFAFRGQCIHFITDTLALEVKLTVMIVQADCIRL